MEDKTYGIADIAWHPIAGCDMTLPCAARCWARRTCGRLAEAAHPSVSAFHKSVMDGWKWNGKVRVNERHLADPTGWKTPQVIAAGYHGDLFLASFEDIKRVRDVTKRCPWHVFVILTKRPERVLEFEKWPGQWGRSEPVWPSNVILGLSAWDQESLDATAPAFLRATAARKIISLTPVGPIDVTRYLSGLDCVVIDGESGPGSRPMHPDWPRGIRDKCEAVRVAYEFKQWGDWAPHTAHLGGGLFLKPTGALGCQGDYWDGRAAAMDRVGKRNAGRVLDGREYNGFSTVCKPHRTTLEDLLHE